MGGGRMDRIGGGMNRVGGGRDEVGQEVVRVK